MTRCFLLFGLLLLLHAGGARAAEDDDKPVETEEELLGEGMRYIRGRIVFDKTPQPEKTRPRRQRMIVNVVAPDKSMSKDEREKLSRYRQRTEAEIEANRQRRRLAARGVRTHDKPEFSTRVRPDSWTSPDGVLYSRGDTVAFTDADGTKRAGEILAFEELFTVDVDEAETTLGLYDILEVNREPAFVRTCHYVDNRLVKGTLVDYHRVAVIKRPDGRKLEAVYRIRRHETPPLAVGQPVTYSYFDAAGEERSFTGSVRQILDYGVIDVDNETSEVPLGEFTAFYSIKEGDEAAFLDPQGARVKGHITAIAEAVRLRTVDGATHLLSTSALATDPVVRVGGAVDYTDAGGKTDSGKVVKITWRVGGHFHEKETKRFVSDFISQFDDEMLEPDDKSFYLPRKCWVAVEFVNQVVIVEGDNGVIEVPRFRVTPKR